MAPPRVPLPASLCGLSIGPVVVRLSHEGVVAGEARTKTPEGPAVMAMVTKSARATVSDLYKAPGKAELVNGELVLMPPTGIDPGYAAGEIFASLREHVRRSRRGRAFTDNAGFLVALPHRQSFSPDAAYCSDDQRGMKFHRGAPRFAAEIRSESDYGVAAEGAMAAKRAD